MRDLKTKAETLAALTHALTVLVQPRFGNSERWVWISKAQARALMAGIKANDTPEKHEMYTGSFGCFDEATRCLYLG